MKIIKHFGNNIYLVRCDCFKEEIGGFMLYPQKPQEICPSCGILVVGIFNEKGELIQPPPQKDNIT